MNLDNSKSVRLKNIDFLIENKTDMKIDEIFEKKGENAFRSLEKEITNILKLMECDLIIIVAE